VDNVRTHDPIGLRALVLSPDIIVPQAFHSSGPSEEQNRIAS
jgi:hypothetical protein